MQLADFRSSIQEFESEGIKVISGSVDPFEKAQEVVSKLGLTYPVAHGLDPEETSRMTGALYDETKRFLHATGVLLPPDNTVAVACCSTGPIGRLMAQDVLKLVRFYRRKR